MYGWAVNRVLDREREVNINLKHWQFRDIMRHWAELWKKNIVNNWNEEGRREAEEAEKRAPMRKKWSGCCMFTNGDGQQCLWIWEKL